MTKILFLDRDGTINEDEGYTYQVEKLKIFPDAIKYMKKFMDAGYEIMIVTNQSGISRGYFTIEDFGTFTRAMLKELKKHGIVISEIFACPHHPDMIGHCRKPDTEMVTPIINNPKYDIKNSFMVGDKNCDKDFADNLGCKFIKVVNGKWKMEGVEI